MGQTNPGRTSLPQGQSRGIGSVCAMHCVPWARVGEERKEMPPPSHFALRYEACFSYTCRGLPFEITRWP
eukprot:10920742-Lingulodinium_polyedra.AAC.1